MFSPQTNIRLLSVPLELDSANTLTWNSKEAQANYFLSKTVYSYADCTYQRREGFIRIDKNIDQLYSCNYVMYRNNAHTDKWFYAYITDFEYVNDNVTYVYIEEDPIQTWYFDVHYKRSYVVREHTNNDAIGANIREENLGLGPYVTNKKSKMYVDTKRIGLLYPLKGKSATGYTIVTQSVRFVTVTDEALFISKLPVAQTTEIAYQISGAITTWNGLDISGNEASYGFKINTSVCRVGYVETTIIQPTGGGASDSAINPYNNNVIGYEKKRVLFSKAGVNELSGIFKTLIEDSLMDDVGGLYLEPFFADVNTEFAPVPKQDFTFNPKYTLDGYKPKNNKLLCYPYNVIKVHNASDSSRVLQPELFSKYSEMVFYYWSDCMPSCTVTATPVNYAGAEQALEYSINSAKYPLSSRAYDIFKNYLGIHAREYNISVATRLASGAASVYGGITGTGGGYESHGEGMTMKGQRKIENNGVVTHKESRHTDKYSNSRSSKYIKADSTRLSQIANGAGQIAGTLAEVNAKQNEAFGTVGSISNSNLNASGDLNIYVEQQTINAQYAQQIDNYFSMYGYKTCDVKIPNITGRRNWNYVQTKEVNITGDIPNDSLNEIRSILNSGVTFWHDPATMYDYTQDNSII